MQEFMTKYDPFIPYTAHFGINKNVNTIDNMFKR